MDCSLTVSDTVASPDFAAHWANDEMESNTILAKPFKLCHVEELASCVPEGFFHQMRSELQELGYIAQDSDLFAYSQAKCDLLSATLPAVKSAVTFLKGPVRRWLAKLTGIELNDTMTLTSSLYEKGNYLLCHDDEVRDRRIAFIWYIMEPGWTAADGGQLQVFDTNAVGEPTEVVRSFVPNENSFAFFPISPRSYHQVSEVLTDKKRFSINGWFHGEPLSVPERSRLVLRPIPVKPSHVDEKGVTEWINNIYIDPDVQQDVRDTFCEQSEIELQDFLAPEKYQLIVNELKSADSETWRRMGPPTKQNYEKFFPCTGNYEKYPGLHHCLQLFRSEAMFLILSQLTGLKLHPLAEPDFTSATVSTETSSGEGAGCSSKPEEPPEKTRKIDTEVANGGDGCQPSMTCTGSLRSWKPGCYTLVHNEMDETEVSLDLLFSVCPTEVEEGGGGYTAYLDKEEGEELMRIVPEANCVSLVYKTAGTVSFKKYVSQASAGNSHYDVAFSYFE